MTSDTACLHVSSHTTVPDAHMLNSAMCEPCLGYVQDICIYMHITSRMPARHPTQPPPVVRQTDRPQERQTVLLVGGARAQALHRTCRRPLRAARWCTRLQEDTHKRTHTLMSLMGVPLRAARWCTRLQGRHTSAHAHICH